MQEILESQRTCEKRLLQYKRDHNELVELLWVDGSAIFKKTIGQQIQKNGIHDKLWIAANFRLDPRVFSKKRSVTSLYA